jgi:hypothetical protein
MTIQQTYYILKYGYMNPSKAKDIISEYFLKTELERYEYWSDWETIDDGFTGYTHFLSFDIKHVDSKILIVISSLSDGLVKHTIDITMLNPKEVVTVFSDYYEELRKEEAWKEHKENYPDGDWEQ